MAKYKTEQIRNVALLGHSGAGKTTLFKLLANRVEADEGRRTIVPGTNVVLLEQEPDLTGFATLRDYTISSAGAPPLHEVEAIAGQLGIDLSREAATASGGCFTRPRTCCTSAAPARGRCSKRGCSSPSSRW